MSKNLEDLGKLLNTMQTLVERKKKEENLIYPLNSIFDQTRGAIMDLDHIVKLHQTIGLPITKDAIMNIVYDWRLLPGITSIHFVEARVTGHEKGIKHSFEKVEDLAEIQQRWTKDNPVVWELSSKYFKIELWLSQN